MTHLNRWQSPLLRPFNCAHACTTANSTSATTASSWASQRKRTSKQRSTVSWNQRSIKRKKKNENYPRWKSFNFRKAIRQRKKHRWKKWCRIWWVHMRMTAHRSSERSWIGGGKLLVPIILTNSRLPTLLKMIKCKRTLTLSTTIFSRNAPVHFKCSNRSRKTAQNLSEKPLKKKDASVISKIWAGGISTEP